MYMYFQSCDVKTNITIEFLITENPRKCIFISM